MTISEHVSEFGGLPVRQYRLGAGLPNVGGTAWRVGQGADSDDETAPEAQLRDLIGEPDADKIEALVIGVWFEDYTAAPPNNIIGVLERHRDRLKSLKRVFFGDVTCEECEISWLTQTNVTPLLDAYPALEEFVVRGVCGGYAPEGNALRLENLRHDNLRSLTVQTGGLSAECLADVAGAELPNLESLTLWLGAQEYGGDWTFEGLGPIFQGEGLPKLRRLGLCDSERADEIAGAIVDAPILEQLEELDLSMGTLGDEGAAALLASGKIKKLKRLNLRHHYMGEETMAAFAKLEGVKVNVEDRQEEDVWEHKGVTERSRYCEVTE